MTNAQKIAQALQKKKGRSSVDQQEANLHEATVSQLAGDKSVAKALSINPHQIKAYLSQLFPDEQDRYTFLEECAITNAALSNARFKDSFSEMTPMEAAKAYGIFAGKAVEIRKAKEANFREAPISPQILIQLEKTLQMVAPAKVIDI